MQYDPLFAFLFLWRISAHDLSGDFILSHGDWPVPEGLKWRIWPLDFSRDSFMLYIAYLFTFTGSVAQPYSIVPSTVSSCYKSFTLANPHIYTIFTEFIFEFIVNVKTYNTKSVPKESKAIAFPNSEYIFTSETNL